MNTEQIIINGMIEDLTQHTCILDRRKIVSLFIPEKDKSSIIGVAEDGSKGYFSYVPYEYEHEKIHGNTRNKIAKMFLEQVTLEQLYRLHAEYLQKQKEKALKGEAELPILETLLQEVYTIIPCNEVTKEIGTDHNIMKYYILIKYRYDEIRVYLNGDNFTFRKDYKNSTVNKAELIEQLEIVNIAFMTEKKRIEDEQKAKLKAAEQERQLLFFTWYAMDKNNITILKMPHGYMAIGYETRWAIGEGKEGKYMNTDSGKLCKMITDKHINEYCTMSNDEYDNMRKPFFYGEKDNLNEVLKALPYKLIAEYQEQNAQSVAS